MTIYIALGDCGDYYCDGEHLLVVSRSSEYAHEIGEQYKGTDPGKSFTVLVTEMETTTGWISRKDYYCDGEHLLVVGRSSECAHENGYRENPSGNRT